MTFMFGYLCGLWTVMLLIFAIGLWKHSRRDKFGETALCDSCGTSTTIYVVLDGKKMCVDCDLTHRIKNLRVVEDSAPEPTWGDYQ